MFRWLESLFGTRKNLIRVVHRIEPFDFKGVDRISILGENLATVKTVIPFKDPQVVESQIPFDPMGHRLDDGSQPHYIHRFTRPDRHLVDFLIHDGRIALVVESTKPYLPRSC